MFWTCVVFLAALIFQNSTESLVIVGLKIASFTYGGLLGLFLLSKIKLKFSPLDVGFSFFISIIMMFVLNHFKLLGLYGYLSALQQLF